MRPEVLHKQINKKDGDWHAYSNFLFSSCKEKVARPPSANLCTSRTKCIVFSQENRNLICVAPGVMRGINWLHVPRWCWLKHDCVTHGLGLMVWRHRLVAQSNNWGHSRFELGGQSGPRLFHHLTQRSLPCQCQHMQYSTECADQNRCSPGNTDLQLNPSAVTTSNNLDFTSAMEPQIAFGLRDLHGWVLNLRIVCKCYFFKWLVSCVCWGHLSRKSQQLPFVLASIQAAKGVRNTALCAGELRDLRTHCPSSPLLSVIFDGSSTRKQLCWPALSCQSVHKINEPQRFICGPRGALVFQRCSLVCVEKTGLEVMSGGRLGRASQTSAVFWHLLYFLYF